MTAAFKEFSEMCIRDRKKGQAALDKQNAPMIADSITPRQTKFETNKEKLRQTLRKALALSLIHI